MIVDVTHNGPKGYVTNCLIHTRQSGFGNLPQCIFYVDEDCTIIPQLDNYAIIPMEEYNKLVNEGENVNGK